MGSSSEERPMALILEIKLVKSTIGYPKRQGRTIKALGLHKIGETVSHRDGPALRGMIRAARHLVEVKERPETPEETKVRQALTLSGAVTAAADARQAAKTAAKAPKPEKLAKAVKTEKPVKATKAVKPGKAVKAEKPVKAAKAEGPTKKAPAVVKEAATPKKVAAKKTASPAAEKKVPAKKAEVKEKAPAESKAAKPVKAAKPAKTEDDKKAAAKAPKATKTKAEKGQ